MIRQLRLQPSDLSFEDKSDHAIVMCHGSVCARIYETDEWFQIQLPDGETILSGTKEDTVQAILDRLRTLRFIATHVSDTHGRFPILPENKNVVIHSGDMLPNATRGETTEPAYQQQWVRDHIDDYRQWLDGRKLIYCAGNHDFTDPIEILIDNGIDAVNITNKLHTHEGVTLYGFPYIPEIVREWKYEANPYEMQQRIRKLKDVIEQHNVDVLVTHCPPYGLLDSNFVIRYDDSIISSYGQHCGNRHLSDYLSYGIENIPLHKRPRYLLCGHVHEHYGFEEALDLTISNAATRVHTIGISL